MKDGECAPTCADQPATWLGGWLTRRGLFRAPTRKPLAIAPCICRDMKTCELGRRQALHGLSSLAASCEFAIPAGCAQASPKLHRFLGSMVLGSLAHAAPPLKNFLRPM